MPAIQMFHSGFHTYTKLHIVYKYIILKCLIPANLSRLINMISIGKKTASFDNNQEPNTTLLSLNSKDNISLFY